MLNSLKALQEDKLLFPLDFWHRVFLLKTSLLPLFLGWQPRCQSFYCAVMTLMRIVLAKLNWIEIFYLMCCHVSFTYCFDQHDCKLAENNWVVDGRMEKYYYWAVIMEVFYQGFQNICPSPISKNFRLIRVKNLYRTLDH